MPKQAAEVATAFRSRTSNLSAARVRIDGLLASGTIPQRDAEEIYRGLFLGLLVSFEHALEDLFIGLLVPSRGYTSLDRRVHPRITLRSREIAWDLLFQEVKQRDKRYIDWVPLERTTRLAGAFFTGGRPFSYLTDAARPVALAQTPQLVSNAQLIRNALAHPSRAAQSKFERIVLPSGLLPRERRPAGFLMGTGPQGTPRIEFYAEQLLVAVDAIAR